MRSESSLALAVNSNRTTADQRKLRGLSWRFVFLEIITDVSYVKYGIRKLYVGDGFRKLSEKRAKSTPLFLRVSSLVVPVFRHAYGAAARNECR